MFEKKSAAAGFLLSTCMLVGFSLPAFSDSLVVRGGVLGGEGLVGVSAGVDYVHAQKGLKPIVVSLDEGVNVEGIFAWDSEPTPTADEFTSLVVSRPVAAGSRVLFGAGLVSVRRRDQGRFTQPALRLTFTSGLNRLLVGQFRLTDVAALGLVADVCLGIGF